MSTATIQIEKTQAAGERSEAKKTLVPQLRFQGFDGMWTNSKLGETFTIFNGYAFASTSSVDKGVLWVKIADVGIQEMKNNNLSYLPFSLKEKHKKFILKKGDFVVALTRPILNGKLKIAKINDFFDGALLNQRVGRIVSINSHYFIYSLLQKTNLINSIENSIAGSDPPNLSPNEINSIKIAIPTLPEQQKIASFLSEVDEKTQQLSRKKELLAQYKKGVMQQLFSGKLRFKDENGNDYADWEEKKLGEVTSYIKGFAFKSKDYQNFGVRIIRVSDLLSSSVKVDNEKVFISYEKAKIYDKYKLQKGNIIITTVGSKPDMLESAVGRGIIIHNENEGLLNQNMLKFENIKGVDNRFLINMINTKRYQYFLKDIARGNANQANITVVDLLNYKIVLPSFQEQQKIADFLSSIDAKIESVNQQITQTQTFKKGLLQQMFV